MYINCIYTFKYMSCCTDMNFVSDMLTPAFSDIDILEMIN